MYVHTPWRSSKMAVTTVIREQKPDNCIILAMCNGKGKSAWPKDPERPVNCVYATTTTLPAKCNCNAANIATATEEGVNWSRKRWRQLSGICLYTHIVYTIYQIYIHRSVRLILRVHYGSCFALASQWWCTRPETLASFCHGFGFGFCFGFSVLQFSRRLGERPSFWRPTNRAGNANG